ncbi:MAG: hypothetical protein ABUL73_02560 [Alphaproteobacteria bacterium]
MIRLPKQIRRPRLLAALIAASAIASLSACLSLFSLSATLSAETPLGLHAATDQLEATLATADWRAPGAGGRVVWLAVAPDCAACAPYAVRVIRELSGDGYEVRVLRLLPGGYGSRRRALRDVAAANGAALQLPALFWRRGDEWRADFGGDRDVREALRDDLGPDT